jgi:hypothetical protein
MKRLSNILADAYLATGSINGYLYKKDEAPYLVRRNIIPAFRWTQLWFLLREVLKKEGVSAPRYASTTYPSAISTISR